MLRIKFNIQVASALAGLVGSLLLLWFPLRIARVSEEGRVMPDFISKVKVGKTRSWGAKWGGSIGFGLMCLLTDLL